MAERRDKNKAKISASSMNLLSMRRVIIKRETKLQSNKFT